MKDDVFRIGRLEIRGLKQGVMVGGFGALLFVSCVLSLKWVWQFW
jgi:hypothetical protein